MLRFLTDSHVPPAVASTAIKLGVQNIIHLRDWQGGLYLHETDPKLLALALREKLTIVTYDVNTFPLHVKARLESGLDHSGVVYVSRRFTQNKVGAIARALLRVWQTNKDVNWTNRIYFLD